VAAERRAGPRHAEPLAWERSADAPVDDTPAPCPGVAGQPFVPAATATVAAHRSAYPYVVATVHRVEVQPVAPNHQGRSGVAPPVGSGFQWAPAKLATALASAVSPASDGEAAPEVPVRFLDLPRAVGSSAARPVPSEPARLDEAVRAAEQVLRQRAAPARVP